MAISEISSNLFRNVPESFVWRLT
ncbi:hypothetical protein CCACVL1_12269 [Corchorus capsularis]|uniref:Uncharacterized protein n=1 Tax=Corchorus capsularis TaxID=210143 RepID=A0A1R3IGJ8_COCAP|nr:hypothetical protein CCACVL1_12269 [Corchorus capsularis]